MQSLDLTQMLRLCFQDDIAESDHDSCPHEEGEAREDDDETEEESEDSDESEGDDEEEDEEIGKHIRKNSYELKVNVIFLSN